MSSSTSMPTREHEERGRDTPRSVVGREKRPLPPSLRRGEGGGESSQPQPDSLEDKSSLYLAILGLKSPPTTAWTIGEKKVNAVFPLLPPPHLRLRGGGRRGNGAQTAHGHQIFRKNLPGAALLPESTRNRMVTTTAHCACPPAVSPIVGTARRGLTHPLGPHTPLS